MNKRKKKTTSPPLIDMMHDQQTQSVLRAYAVRNMSGEMNKNTNKLGRWLMAMDLRLPCCEMSCRFDAEFPIIIDQVLSLRRIATVCMLATTVNDAYIHYMP